MDNNDTYSPNASTPYSSLVGSPPIGQPIGQTPVDMLPDMQNMMGGPYSSNAIRNFGQPSYSSPPLPSSTQMMPSTQPGLPSYSDLLQLYLMNGQPSSNSEENRCKTITDHLKSCSKCSRKYVVDTNSYVAIIIGLVLFVLFLLTKIIDKFG